MTIYTFGDSWAAGYGLTHNQKDFTKWLATYFNCKSKNFGECGSSLGQVLHDFTKRINDISADDLAIIIIPPDTRWYTSAVNGEGVCSLSWGASERKFKQFIKNEKPYWFSYHHSLFVYCIASLCLQRDLKFVLAHNYGYLDLIPPFDNLIPKQQFLSNKSLASLLNVNDKFDPYDLSNDGPDILEGKYFLENDTHPNEKGHQVIAEKIYNKYQELYNP